MQSQLESLRAALSRRELESRIIAVVSGKGGVGKTTIALSLAYWLSRNGQKVLLTDADPGLANLNILLGINPPFHWGDYVRGERSWEEIVVRGIHGMDFVQGFSGFRDESALSEENAHKLMDALRLSKGAYQRIIVDTGAGLSLANLVCMSRADYILLVLGPELTALADAYGTLKTMHLRYQMPQLGVVVNQARDDQHARQIYVNLVRIAHRFLGIRFPLLGWIPQDNYVPIALSRQKPVSVEYPDSAFMRALDSVGKGLQQTLAAEGKS